MNCDFNNDVFFRHIEDAVRNDIDERGIDYDAIWEKLCRKIDAAESLGALCLLKRHETVSDDKWERMETRLFKRIAEHEEYDEPVDECIGVEKALPDNQCQQMESRLLAGIDSLKNLPEWEQALKADVILPQGQWERIEKALMTRLDTHDSQRRAHSMRILHFPLLTALRIAAAITLMVLAGTGGYVTYNRFLAPVPTYVFQAQGANVGMVTAASQNIGTFHSNVNGSVSVVNKHGFVQLHNGASLRLKRNSRSLVHYELALASGNGNKGIEGGKAVFFITPHPGKGTCKVTTSDYDILVTGTCFRIFPDFQDRVATEVLEGSVQIRVEPLGLIELKAGQRLFYNNQAGRYDIQDGGPVISRSEITLMPDLDAIEAYAVLSVTSNVPFADITINNIYRGITPLRILLPGGSHHLRVSREEFPIIDTILQLKAAVPVEFYAVLAEDPVFTAPFRTESALSYPPASRAPLSIAANDDKPKGDKETEISLLAHAKSLEKSDWEKAIECYQSIIIMEHLSDPARQTAHFSISRLLAEHSGDKQAAKDSFLGYLALYPSGIFTRESLLRLAELEFYDNEEKAIEYYLRYFEKYPDHYRVSELQYQVGLMYLQKKRYDEAVYMLRQALSNMVYGKPQMRRRIYTSLHRAFTEMGDRANAAIIEKDYLSEGK